MTRAARYLHQGSEATGEGVAVARQRELCDRLADARGWSVAGWREPVNLLRRGVLKTLVGIP